MQGMTDDGKIFRQIATTAAPALLWTTIGCPFDVIKTRLQTAKTPFASPLHCLAWTVRREGVMALSKGFAPMLLTSTPYSVIMFSSYELLKPSLTPEGAGAGYLGSCFLAGAASGVAVTVVHNPLELWRVRVQTHLPVDSSGSSGSSGSGAKVQARTSSHVLRTLLSQPRQLVRGASMTLAENVIGNGAFFGSNEALRQVQMGWRKQSLVAEILVGGLTGLVFQVVTYPFDIVKAQVMTQEGVHTSQVAKRILLAEGLAGFYRGATVAIVRAFAINAAGWPALREAQRRLGVAVVAE
jgi:solute carrier family 25 carnitine/acylcarnitine transporter 20/29